METIREYNFEEKVKAGIIIVAGGFEDRALTFANKLKKKNNFVENVIIIQYKSQYGDNKNNFDKLFYRMKYLTDKEPIIAEVSAETPVKSSNNIREIVSNVSSNTQNKIAYIDISGMTHLWSISAMDSCVGKGFITNIIYTEAKWYYPKKRELKQLLTAWNGQDYNKAAEYLQSAALKSIHILPQFGGDIRPSRQNCLIIFAGYEPNRIQGLVDSYAPGAIIVYYGQSPHNELQWRTELSAELHKELFSQFKKREEKITTFKVDKIVKSIEKVYYIINNKYDIAIAPQCSKMQAVGVYEFWRKHPEVQLVFTTPVRFNPNRYSRYSRETFIYKIGSV